MNSCDVYIVAPIAKLTCDDGKPLGSNIFKLHEVINRITKRYNTKVDIYSLANVKINSVPRSYSRIDVATCVIIIIPSENMSDFMLLIGHAITRNKKIYILLLDNKTHGMQTGVIVDVYENVYVDCVNPPLNDFDRLSLIDKDQSIAAMSRSLSVFFSALSMFIFIVVFFNDGIGYIWLVPVSMFLSVLMFIRFRRFTIIRYVRILRAYLYQKERK